MKKTLISMALLGATLFSWAQAPEIEWQRAYGGTALDYLHAVQATTDGGYIAVGESFSTDGEVSGNNGSLDAWLLKVDSNGEIEWENSFGGTDIDFAFSVIEDTDGGFVFVGGSFSADGDINSNQGEADAWVLKVDNNGDSVWSLNYGGSADDRLRDIIKTADNGYIATGVSSSNDGDITGQQGGGDLMVTKIDSSGQIEWTRLYGGTQTDDGESIIQTSDGGYAVTGSSQSSDGDLTTNKGILDVWTIKIASNGDLEWQSSYGGSFFDLGRDIAQTTDGGYFVAAWTGSGDGDVSLPLGNQDFWGLKLDATGNLEWEKTYGGTGADAVAKMATLDDGGFAIVGQTASSDGQVSENNGFFDVWVMRINSSGDLLWESSLGGSDFDYGSDIQTTPDGGFVVGAAALSTDGDVEGNTQGDQSFWIAKLQPENLSIEDSPQNAIALYPNPTSNTVSFSENHDFKSIALYDTTGSVLFEKEGHQQEISLKNLPSGVYLLKVQLNDSSFNTFRIIKK